MPKEITKLRHRSPFKQLHTFIKNLLDHWPEFVLILITLFLAFANYSPNTWLTGWDNLHPELNFPLDIRRSIFSVWQEYRGLGLLGGMAHAADLPRIIFLYSLSIFNFPFSIYRYLWTFLCLGLGPLGTYFLLKSHILKSRFDLQTVRFASFLGALFYLLNLATVQYFFTPFETFHSFYAFFPFIIFAIIHYLERPKIKNYLTLTLVLIFSSPSFYVQTLFVVLVLCLIPVFYEIIHSSHKKTKTIKSTTLALLTLIVTQSYWLLPVSFFVLTKSGTVSSAHINLVSSAETQYRNLEFATLKDVALLKGYWFNYLDLATPGKYDYLLLPWRHHLDQPIIQLLGYFSFALVLTGAIYSFRKKISYSFSVLAILFISSFFILGGHLLLGRFFPILGELFRSPFTKFSITLAFSYSIFFSIGCIFLLDLFSFLHTKLTYLLTLFSVSIALIIFTTPAFTGNLISPSMRQKIPSEYLELFKFFDQQDPNTRIANFPQYTFWGWNYYSWGYRGSGFLWYGLKQPILDRAFDVWEPASEKYYEAINTALYSQDSKKFESIIDQYAINWILIDKNIIAPSPDIDLGNDKLQKILDSSSKFTLIFSAGNISVYKANLDQKIHNFISLSPSLRGVLDETIHPFSSLPFRPTPTQIINNSLNLKSQISNIKSINIPSYSDSESLIPISVSYKKTATGLELKFTPVLPEILLNNQKMNLNSQANLVDFNLQKPESGLIIGINDQYYELQLPDELAIQNTFYPLTNIYLSPQKNISLTLYSNTPSYRLDLTSAFSQAAPYQCYTDKPNRHIEKIIDEQSISLYGTDLVGCLSTPIPSGNQNQLLSLEFTYYSHTNTPANANITNSSLNGHITPQSLIAKTEPTFNRIFTHAQNTPLQANLILEANDLKTTQEIIYKNVQVSYLPQLAETNFFLNPIPAQQIHVSNEQRSMSNISISLPLIENPLTINSTPTDNHFLANVINCDNFDHGQYQRLTNFDNFLYSATNANSCDQISLRHLPHDINYAIIANVKNQTGLSPTLCLENYSTRRCDIFERLINGSQLILQPIRNPNEPPGYTLHLFNQSFGPHLTQNLIHSITITPFPLNFLQNITINTSSLSPSKLEGETQLLRGEGVLISSHPAEFLYTLSVIASDSAAIHTNNILNLYQTNSPYWKALEVSENDLKLPLWQLIFKLPFLYFSNHAIRYMPLATSQNWYNSWSIPAGNHHLIIFYLPQYLEFLGFLLLPLPFIGIIIFHLLQKFKN